MQLYKGYFTSAVDLFHIKVHGKSGHGSAPHTACDAIACAGYLITVLQTVVAAASTDGHRRPDGGPPCPAATP